MGKRATTAEFIERAIKVHGDKYDYSLVEYISSTAKVKIVCKKHGVFEQSPVIHLGGSGCKRCATDRSSKKLTLSTANFIDKAQEVHGLVYSYKDVIYTHSHNPVIISCMEHGKFSQRPYSHINGHGCPTCAASGFSSNSVGSVYVLQSDSMVKIGVTNRFVADRINQINHKSPQQFDLVFNAEMLGSIALKVERRLIHWLRKKYQQPIDKFDGYKECFLIGSGSYTEIVNKLLEFEARYSPS